MGSSISPSLSWCVNLILYVLNYINNCYGSPSLLSWPESMFFRLATLASTCHFPTPVHSPRRGVASGFRPLALNPSKNQFCAPLQPTRQVCFGLYLQTYADQPGQIPPFADPSEPIFYSLSVKPPKYLLGSARAWGGL